MSLRAEPCPDNLASFFSKSCASDEWEIEGAYQRETFGVAECVTTHHHLSRSPGESHRFDENCRDHQPLLPSHHDFASEGRRDDRGENRVEIAPENSTCIRDTMFADDVFGLSAVHARINALHNAVPLRARVGRVHGPARAENRANRRALWPARAKPVEPRSVSSRGADIGG